MYCRQKNLRYELKNLRYELILNTGRYCHIEFTRLDIHLACISVSPWCSLLIQSSPFAWPHFLLHQPLIPWSHPICCCSWNAWNVFWPMSSVGPGDMPGHWTCPLVDHWETPDSSMSMTNVHVGFCILKLVPLSMHLYGYLRPLDIGIHAPEFPGSVDILGICDQYPVPSGDVET